MEASTVARTTTRYFAAITGLSHLNSIALVLPAGDSASNSALRTAVSASSLRGVVSQTIDNTSTAAAARPYAGLNHAAHDRDDGGCFRAA